MNMIAPPPEAPRLASIPVEPFVSPDYYQLEQDHVFRDSWLMVGSVHQLPKPGDYFTRELKVLGLSLIVIRGRDGEIRAFHNVCTHRGKQLAPGEGCGSARAFTCPVHGFTFDLQGKLAFVPPELTFQPFDKATRGLVPLAVDTWHGFVFIYPAAEAPRSLHDYLGEAAIRSEGHELINWHRLGRYSMTAAVNWKSFQGSFMETAHVKTIHRRTVEDYAAEVVPPFLAEIGDHSLFSNFMNLHHELHPVEKLALGASPGFMTLSGEEQLPGLNPLKKSNWTFDQFMIYPNFLLYFGDGWCTSHVFWPEAPDKTYWEGCYYAKPSQRASQDFANHYFAVKVRDTVREDLEAVESMQKGIASGAVKEVLLCAEEALLGHIHTVTERRIGAGRPA